MTISIQDELGVELMKKSGVDTYLSELIRNVFVTDVRVVFHSIRLREEQMAAIQILRQRGVVENLPRKLQQALVAREQNPEASLSELAAMMEPAISKPAMNHRLKKLVEMAKEEG